MLQHTFYKLHSSATESNELNITLENTGGPPMAMPPTAAPGQQQQHFHGMQQQQQPPPNMFSPQQQQQDIVLHDPNSGLPAYPTTIQVRTL